MAATITCTYAEDVKVNNDNTSIMRVDLIATEVPETMPEDGGDIDVFYKNANVPEATTFAAGSTMLVPSAAKMYLHDGATFYDQEV